MASSSYSLRCNKSGPATSHNTGREEQLLLKLYGELLNSIDSRWKACRFYSMHLKSLTKVQIAVGFYDM